MNLRQVGLIVVLTAIAGACSRSEAAIDPAGSPTPLPANSGSLHETANYKVTLEAPGPYKKGEEGVVKVVLVTKGDFHINEQYPYKFVPHSPASDGIRYPKKVVRRADGDFAKTRAELPIPFVADEAGEAKIGGLFSLSVCTESNCLLDKRPLEIAVTVE